MSVDNERICAPRGLFVGLTTVDIILSFERFPAEDTKNTAQNYAIVAGGPAANAAVAFSHLGGAAQLVSSFGRSSVADIAKRDLARYAVQYLDITQARDEDPPLSAIAIAEDSGSRTILTSPAIHHDLDAPVDPGPWASLVAAADIVLLDGHQLKVAEAVARAAKLARKTIVLDGDIYKADVENILPLVDIVIFGKSFVVDGSHDASELFAYFASHGVSHIVATNGAGPVDFIYDGAVGRIEVEPVRVVDTLAAGDFFHGAFCYALASGFDTRSALSFACKVARQSVTRFGTRAWMQEDELASSE